MLIIILPNIVDIVQIVFIIKYVIEELVLQTQISIINTVTIIGHAPLIIHVKTIYAFNMDNILTNIHTVHSNKLLKIYKQQLNKLLNHKIIHLKLNRITIELCVLLHHVRQANSVKMDYVKQLQLVMDVLLIKIVIMIMFVFVTIVENLDVGPIMIAMGTRVSMEIVPILELD